MSATAIHATPQPGALIWREIPILVWALADVSLVVPLFLVIMPWARQWPVWALALYAFVLILVPFNLARVMTLWGVPVRLQRRWLGAGLVFTLLVSLRQLLFSPEAWLDLRWLVELLDHLTIAGYPFWARDFGIIGLVLYCWWRGMSLPDRSFSIGWIGLQFRLRALVLAPIVIILGGRRLISDISPFIILFGVSHLIMIALARAEEVQRHETGLNFLMTPRWLATVGAASGLIVGASWFLAWTAGTEAVARGPQQGVFLTVSAAFFTFIVLVAPVLFPLLEWITTYLTRLFAPLSALLAQFSTGNQPDQSLQIEEVPAEGATGLVAQLASYLPALVFLVIVAAIIWFVIWWYQRRVSGENPDENRETITLDGSLKAKGFTDSIWDQIRRSFPGLRRWRAARSIRRIYYQMVYAAEHRGVARRPAQTPYEYLPDLAAVWPGGGRETSLITQAYVRVRYGEIPENPAELQEILQAWDRLETQLLEEG